MTSSAEAQEVRRVAQDHRTGMPRDEGGGFTGVPVWFDDRPTRHRAPLDRDLTTDVLVVGAGITGASTAWELARSGREVALLEARTVAAGTTGGSTAKASVLQGTSYSTIAARTDIATASRYARTQELAVHHLASVVDRLGIACDLERRASWLWADDERGADQLRREAEILAECDVPVRTDRDPRLPFDVTAALSLEDQLLLDPVAYVDALVADLEAHGGRVFEHSTLVDLEPGDPNLATTHGGQLVRARHVVLATHFPPFQQGLLFARLRPRREHVLLVRPGASPRPGMYVGAAGVSLRPTRAGWLVSGASYRPGSADAAVRLDDLLAWTRQNLPGSEVLRTWSAQDYDSPDGLPFIGRLGRRGKVWGATGFGGWGIANGVLSGVLLRDLVVVGDDGGPVGAEHRKDWRELFTTRRASLLSEVSQMRAQAATLVDGARTDRARGAAPHVPGTPSRPEDLGRHEAARIQVGDQAVAAYRDGYGVLHTRSATCPHMGCLVDFEQVSAEWQCPCHGSRFDPTGRLLEGPATNGLPPAHVD